MNHGLRNATQQLVNHGSLVFFRNAVEGLLYDVTAESVHTEGKCVTADGLSNGNDLVRRAMLEAALDQEVTEAVDHQGIGLSDDSFDNVVLLIRSTDLEFLL